MLQAVNAEVPFLFFFLLFIQAGTVVFGLVTDVHTSILTIDWSNKLFVSDIWLIVGLLCTLIHIFRSSHGIYLNIFVFSSLPKMDLLFSVNRLVLQLGFAFPVMVFLRHPRRALSGKWECIRLEKGRAGSWRDARMETCTWSSQITVNGLFKFNKGRSVLFLADVSRTLD